MRFYFHINRIVYHIHMRVARFSFRFKKKSDEKNGTKKQINTKHTHNILYQNEINKISFIPNEQEAAVTLFKYWTTKMKNNKLTDFGFLWLVRFLWIIGLLGPFENIVFRFWRFECRVQLPWACFIQSKKKLKKRSSTFTKRNRKNCQNCYFEYKREYFNDSIADISRI